MDVSVLAEEDPLKLNTELYLGWCVESGWIKHWDYLGLPGLSVFISSQECSRLRAHYSKPVIFYSGFLLLNDQSFHPGRVTLSTSLCTIEAVQFACWYDIWSLLSEPC